jgi:hypothetical protein
MDALMGVNVSHDFMSLASSFLNCKLNYIPFKYLGLPIGTNHCRFFFGYMREKRGKQKQRGYSLTNATPQASARRALESWAGGFSKITRGRFADAPIFANKSAQALPSRKVNHCCLSTWKLSYHKFCPFFYFYIY